MQLTSVRYMVANADELPVFVQHVFVCQQK